MARRRRRSVRVDKTPQNAFIETLSHEGSGIARIEGKTTFIQGALPGEEISFIYTEKKKDYDKGVVHEVLKPSSDRVEAPCPHYDVCGGCSLQHLKVEKQIEYKEKVLLENLQHIGGAEPDEVLPAMLGETLGYRHKARLSVKYVQKKQDILVGFRERLSGRFIANIEQCKVLDPKVGQLIRPFRDLFMQLSNYEQIAQIEVATGENKTVLILRHLSEFVSQDLTLLTEFGQQHDVCWYLQPGGNDTIHPLLAEDKDELFYHLPELDLKFSFRPNDFTQVNPSINEKMVPLAMKLLDIQPQDNVLDLFCGLGNFSLPMAQKAHRLVGVEGCDKMTARALKNAQCNDIHNVSFYQADLFKEIDDATWVDQSFDKIMLDPPRAGAKEICEQIERFGAKRIVYVSCASATLARDTKILLSKGYHLECAGVMDMFPHTAHVESIALFTK